jgi:UDP-N-acetylglucosamine--N-acetylmuramyl-(pentapeptide) pyrophosphoryl-undecaprenol N-acetylglucosamine transferase
MFAGTRTRMEWKAVPKAGYAIFPISVTALHREFSRRTLAFPFRLVQGFAESWGLVRDFDADVAVGTGGFVAGPVLLAASLQGKPTLIQEQNAYAGLTNRLLARRASRIHVAFPEAVAHFPEGRTVLTGNPVRKELAHATRADANHHFNLPEGARTVLVFGGSLGSRAINDAVERHLLSLLDAENRYLVWQTGTQYFDAISGRIAGHPRLRLLEYLDRMDLAYAAADLVVCRAGAITCSELLLTGTPAVLVPSPNVAEDHQTRNARSMAEAGAADLLPEARLDAELVQTVHRLLADEARRTAMSAAARAIAKPDAATEIARDVLNLARTASDAAINT